MGPARDVVLAGVTHSEWPFQSYRSRSCGAVGRCGQSGRRTFLIRERGRGGDECSDADDGGGRDDDRATPGEARAGRLDHRISATRADARERGVVTQNRAFQVAQSETRFEAEFVVEHPSRLTERDQSLGLAPASVQGKNQLAA